jgi:hypothetical protein
MLRVVKGAKLGRLTPTPGGNRQTTVDAGLMYRLDFVLNAMSAVRMVGHGSTVRHSN